MRKVNKRFNGFTLIELLFVIALIGVLASFGVSMMQKRAENFKVEKTALQMQHMLQAGMAWNVNHKSEWPQCGDTRNHSQDQGFYVNYVGENVTDDPWGLHSYQWCNTSKFNPPMGNRFFIDAEAKDNQTAKRIAALLPSADICAEANPHTNTSCSPNNDQGKYVRAYVNVPGQAVNGGITIKDIGMADVNVRGKLSPNCSNYIPIEVNCNQGETADIFTSINNYYNYSTQYSYIGQAHVRAWIKFRTNSKGDNKFDPNDDKPPRCENNGNGMYRCDFKVCAQNAGGTSGLYHPEVDAKFMYLTMCKKSL